MSGRGGGRIIREAASGAAHPTRRTALRLGGAAALGAALPACDRPLTGELRLKVAHTMNATHPVHKALGVFAETLRELSGGRLGADLYASGQLGTERELIELAQIGSVAMTKVSSLSLEGFSPPMRLFSTPYLFEDNAHLWRVLEGDVGRELLDTLGGVRLKGLSYYDAGSRSFYATAAPINHPDDLAGKKIRVLASPVAVEMVAALGGSATPLAFGELYTALQQGIVDGAENNPPSYFLSKHFEIAPYYSLDEHTSPPDVIIMSSHVWEQLDARERDWVTRAMAVSVEAQRRFWNQDQADALAAVEAAGSRVVYPDKQPFRAAVAGMKRTAMESDDLGPLIRRVDALAGAS